MHKGLVYSKTIDALTCNFYPIYDWRTRDIWIANASYEFDYNKIYDLYYQAGLTIDQMRVASPFHQSGQDNLKLYKTIDPNSWGKMVGRVNGVNFTLDRGEVLCILDLRRILSPGKETAPPAATEGKFIVVIQHGGKEAGFLVDAVRDVTELPASSVHPVLDSIDPSRARLFEGTVACGRQFVGLLSPSACLNP